MGTGLGLRRPFRRLPAVIFILLLALSSAAVEASSDCQDVVFDRAPIWTLNGIWAEGTQAARLLLPDFKRNRVLGYSDEGRLRPSGLSSLESDIPGYHPVRLLRGSQGLVIQLTKARLALQDGTIRNLKEVQVLRPTGEPGLPELGRLGRLYLVEIAGPDAVVFADVVFNVGGSEIWRSGFLRVPLRPAAGQDQVTTFLGDRSWPAEGEFHLRYELMHPYLATEGSTAYILIMDETPEIFINESGGTELQPLGVAGLDRLELSAPATLYFGEPFHETFRLTMKEVEISAMAVGLYAWEDGLYLLTREPDAGGTAWWLTRISPEEGQVIGSSRIRTAANHLVVVPGHRHWAFVGKGPYTSSSQQEIQGAVLVDAALIRGIGNSTPSLLCGEGELSMQRFADVR